MLNNRYDLVLYFDCADGNPNGDPDAGNMPRTDPETQQALVSDVCQKRKVRDFVYLTHLDGNGAPKEGYDIFFGHSNLPDRQILNPQIEQAFLASLPEDERSKIEEMDGKKRETALKKAVKGKHVEASHYLCKTRFDIRTFGAVLSTGLNAGQVRGPVQCTFARSVDPVVSLDMAITRKSLAKQADADKQLEKDGTITGTFGRKNIIPYGLFRSHWFVSPNLAKQTGFSDDDFKVLCDALLGMFELDRSAARGMMATQALYVFKHESALGNAPSHRLFDRITAKQKTEVPRAFSDYSVDEQLSDLPEGVQCFNLVEPDQYKALFG